MFQDGDNGKREGRQEQRCRGQRNDREGRATVEEWAMSQCKGKTKECLCKVKYAPMLIHLS